MHRGAPHVPGQPAGLRADRLRRGDVARSSRSAGTSPAARRRCQSFTGEDCRAHLRQHLLPSTLVVSVSGGFDPAGAAAMIDEAIGPWAAAHRPVPEAVLAATPPTGPPLRVIRRSAEQANILVGARAPSYNDPDRHVADILNVDPRRGDVEPPLPRAPRAPRARLRRPLVHEPALRHAECSGSASRASRGRPPIALEAAIAELRRLAEEPVGDAELTKAREYTKGRLLLQLESTSALCEYAGQQLLLQGRIIEPEEPGRASRGGRRGAGERACGPPARRGLRAAVVGPFRSETRFEKAIAG